MSISQPHHLLESNIQTIAQLIDMLRIIDTKLYANTRNNAHSTIGAHTRHIVEFYQEFTPLLAEDTLSTLSYDNRKRDLLLEHSKDKAIEILEAVSLLFATTTLENRKVTLSCISLPELPPSHMESNLERELMYLLDHSNHHMAIIKMLAEHGNITFDERFGVAGATLLYQQKQSA